MEVNLPRPYNSKTRRAAAQRTRAKIVAAARRFLRAPKGISELTIDSVAAEAGVARMTVYNTMKSKSGLLEAILDDISESGLPEIFPPSRGARETLDNYLAAFAHFWEAERLSVRRLRALAVLDPDVEAAIAEREQRRWNSTRELVARFEAEGKPLLPLSIDLLHVAASFESYDRLRIMGRSARQAAHDISALCRAIVALPG